MHAIQRCPLSRGDVMEGFAIVSKLKSTADNIYYEKYCYCEVSINYELCLIEIPVNWATT